MPFEKVLPEKISAAIVRQIELLILRGILRPGERLPSEAQLTEAFSVSRTVIREAIATLRADGLVEPRQGAGVFVLEPAETAQRPFQIVDVDKISSIIEMLELRTAVERLSILAEGEEIDLDEVTRRPRSERSTPRSSRGCARSWSERSRRRSRAR